MKHDIVLLEKLLNKSSDQIIQDAIDCYVLHALSPEQRNVYSKFLALSNGATPPKSSRDDAGVARFSVAPEAKAMRFSPRKTRGSIMINLMSIREFSREEFRATVANVMGWNADSKRFSIKTKFRDLDQAERTWWGTLKGRDKLIREEPAPG